MWGDKDKADCDTRCKDSFKLNVNFFIFSFLYLSFNLSSSGMIVTRLNTLHFSTFPALNQLRIRLPTDSLGQIPLDSSGGTRGWSRR